MDDLHVRRCYHEAGHAVLALHLGFTLRDILCDPTVHEPGKGILRTNASRTIFDPSPATSRLDIVRVSLAGGIAEDVFLSGRAVGCCTNDLDDVQRLLREEGVPADEWPAIIAEAERDLRMLLSQEPLKCRVLALAEVLAKTPLVPGAWAVELLKKACPGR
jgi:hypothetical protein